jgi:hypothetical protein
MEIGTGKKIVLAGFSLLCLACVLGIAFVFYDAVSTAMDSQVQGVGAAAVFLMVVGFLVRLLLNSRQV